MTLIGNNVKNDILTLFLSLEGWDLVQVTFKWEENKWKFEDCNKVIDFRLKKEYESAAQYIVELNKQCDNGIQQFADLLFGNTEDKEER